MTLTHASSYATFLGLFHTYEEVRLNDARRQRVINSQLGVRLGDLAGMQVEMMSREEILAATAGVGIRHPRHYVDPKFRKVPDTRGLKPGMTTDDTAQNDANARGFLMAGAYHHELFTLLLMRSFHENPGGAGGTTKLAIWEMEKHYREKAMSPLLDVPPEGLSKKDLALWTSAVPRNPFHRATVTGKGYGRGNGPAMRIGPFAHWHALCNDVLAPETMLAEVLAHSWATHADTRAGIAAYALAVTLAQLVNGPTVRRDPSDDGVYRVTAVQTLRYVLEAESRYRHVMPTGGAFSVPLENVVLAATGNLSDTVALDAAIENIAAKKTSDAMITIPLALAIFLRHPDDPCAAILAAVNAGGDTDTVASMVGALVGANCSGTMFPDDWLDALHDRGRSADELGGTLYDLAVGRARTTGFDLDTIKKELGYL